MQHSPLPEILSFLIGLLAPSVQWGFLCPGLLSTQVIGSLCLLQFPAALLPRPGSSMLPALWVPLVSHGFHFPWALFSGLLGTLGSHFISLFVV